MLSYMLLEFGLEQYKVNIEKIFLARKDKPLGDSHFLGKSFQAQTLTLRYYSRGGVLRPKIGCFGHDPRARCP